MTRYWQAAVVLAIVGGLFTAQAGEKAEDPLFGLTRIHALHLEMTAADWAKMQPASKRFPGFGPARKPAEKAPEQAAKPADVHKSAGAFGTEFPWVRGEFTAGGTTFANVGVRYKGNFTYVASAHMLRRPLKIELDHYDVEQRWHGKKNISLSNGVTDPARSREALAFAVYRAAGVPAPRTAFAELTLTVPGKFDKEYVGLYTLIEQIDKSFLKVHFKDSKGMLLKPENLRGGLEHLGDDWTRYEERYRPKDEPTQEQKNRLIAFIRLVAKADDETFCKEIGAYLDVDAFIRMVAVDALLAHLDSFLGFGHNFYLYLRSDTNQFVFMPWDLDLSMGMWPVGGRPEQQINLSLDHPHIGRNNLIDRLFAIPEVKEKYTKVLKELTTSCFTKEQLWRDIAAIEQATKAALAREKEATAGRKESARGAFVGVVAPALPLRTFVEKRTESALAQLAGERKGYVPAGFGPPGMRPKGPPGPGKAPGE